MRLFNWKKKTNIDEQPNQEVEVKEEKIEEVEQTVIEDELKEEDTKTNTQEVQSAQEQENQNNQQDTEQLHSKDEEPKQETKQEDQKSKEEEEAEAERIANLNKEEPVFFLRVTADKMQAHLSVKNIEKSRKIKEEEILELLKKRGIVYGVRQEEIERVCNLQSFFSEVHCAQGTVPVPGQDGTLTYHFDLDHVLKPKERADGGADFHDMGIVRNVPKDELLCSRTHPIPGEDGKDIFGEVVPFKPGAEMVFGNGANTVISEDTLELRAGIEGRIVFKNKTVSIEDTFTVMGNVDTATGDIVFSGTVIVKGDVCEGFQVRAGKDVVVNGMVEGATIWAGGNVLISQGMNGMNFGKIYSGGSVKSKYIQNAEVKCQGDVVADYYLNGSVIAGGSITAEGVKGLLLGGIFRAGTMIVAKTIGADSYLTTEVEIIESREGFWDPEQQKSKEDIEKELASMPEEEREQWLAENVYITPTAPQDAKVIAKSVAYPGVKVAIGQICQRLEQEYSNSKFFVGEEGIEAGPAPRI